MSYILDALKKSDRDRQRGEVPSLNSVHDRFPDSPRYRLSGRRRKYFFAAFVTVLTVAVFLTTWYWKENNHGFDETVIKEEKLITEKGNLEPPIKLTNTKKKLVIENQIEPSQEEEAAVISPQKKLTQIPRTKKKILAERQPEPIQEEKTPVVLPLKELPETPGIEILPESMRSAIPELNFAGHTYSETPSKRMIIINNKILREGERIDSNLILVTITWTGVILDYNGQKFKVEVN